MRNLLNPKWLFIINTLPIVVLFLIFIGEFNIIKSLLNEESLELWKSFGWTLGILGTLNLAYTIYLTIKKQKVHAIYGFLALICYIPFIYLYLYHSETIIPFSIPTWMAPTGMILYVGAFLMPTLAYALFVLVSHFTSETKDFKAWKSFLMAIIVPATYYLFYQVILPLWEPFDSRFSIHAFFILIITTTLIFLFFLIRGVFILVSNNANTWLKYQLIWKIPVSIILPLMGLAVNSGYLFNEFGATGSSIFGDFSNSWFYILAAINGIFICLPNIENKLYRLFLLFGRSITFTYTLYFLLVFLPYLPLSVIAIVAFGTGFLMLTPLLLFFTHVNEISKDFKYLQLSFSSTLLWIVSIVGLLIIPTSITVTFLKEKRVLNKTLEYVYTPDYSKSYQLNTKSLKKTLSSINQSKNRSSIIVNQSLIPYLSSYYNWLVLGNLTLSDAKINTIEKIFFDESTIHERPRSIMNDSINISDISVESTYDKTQDVWKSWVNLEITNKSGNNWFSEYASTIELPVGCWISGYYLYIGDRKELGILAEKKSALWVFSQIREIRKDPGILYYLTGNKVAFRIYPFAGNEVRKTGIEFLHKDPVKLTIDGNVVQLGNLGETGNKITETHNAIYIPTAVKRSLKQIYRKPYFHFLVDVSKHSKDDLSNIIDRISRVTENNKPLLKNAKISFVNSYVTTTRFDNNWKRSLESHTFEGGFYLDRAIRKTLINSYREKPLTYPILVVITNNIDNAILEKDFSDLKITFPESDLFFVATENGKLKQHSLQSNPFKQLADSIPYSFNHPVLAYQHSDSSVSYLPMDDNPSIILKPDGFEKSGTEIREKNWKTALISQGMWMSQILHPETSNDEWLNLVKYSFVSKIMMPVTSYIVVENDAQKAILKKKQKQVLSGNKSLDPGEDVQQMSEPGLVALLVLSILILFYFERKKKKKKQREYSS
jgi:hypothetical protein